MGKISQRLRILTQGMHQNHHVTSKKTALGVVEPLSFWKGLGGCPYKGRLTIKGEGGGQEAEKDGWGK